MTKRAIGPLFCVLTAIALGCAGAAAQPPVPSEELPAGADVLNRGPVNEAFAEPVPEMDQPGLIAPFEPPADIDEVPPEDRPAGDDYVWIPGYWSWDQDLDDFIWVGACWRAAPPDMYWVPGYWTPVSGGWEWVPGFWASVDERELDYLPAPPPPEQIEAPGPAPDPDDLWVPGCWYWARHDYVFRPGYWLRARPEWVWTPSHYLWTPRGYIFVAGYWDYPFEDRGIVFAPIHFPRTVYATRGFAFTPVVVVDLGAISFSLFTYPRYCHYYFGDFYDDDYFRIGIYPWFDVDRFHTWYDPVFVYGRWHHRHDDPHWADRWREDYERKHHDRDARPPRTWHELRARAATLPEPQRRNIEFVRPMQAVVTQPSARMRFERLSPDSRRQVATSGSEVRRFRVERGRWETPGGQVSPPAPPARPGTTRVTRAPSAASPPPAPEAPPAPARHEVRLKQPERVKIQPPAPTPPAVSRERGKAQERGRTQAAPPSAPKEENQKQTKRTETQRTERARTRGR